ncbi:MAG TPA: response regulator [Thermoanaerobaculia bacterium]|nr:response regulator [Thermoanaerobaculia bacterium]
MPTSDGRREHVDVLVVEDSFEMLQLLVEFLREEGFGAVGAVNGDVALAVLRARLRPSLILLDLKMPAMDGWQFCQELASDPELMDLPVAVLSAVAAPAHELPERKNNAGYLMKPIDFEELLSKVRAHCTPPPARAAGKR